MQLTKTILEIFLIYFLEDYLSLFRTALSDGKYLK